MENEGEAASAWPEKDGEREDVQLPKEKNQKRRKYGGEGRVSSAPWGEIQFSEMYFQTRIKLSYKEKIVIQGENAEEKIGLEASTGGSLLAGAAWCKGRSSAVGNR